MTYKNTRSAGDVTGSTSASDNALPIYSGGSGKMIKDSEIVVDPVSGTIKNKGASRLIGRLIGANMNSVADQVIDTMLGANPKYVVRKIIVTNPSATLATSLAAGGIYTGASKGGSVVVGAGQLYTALTGATKFLDAALALTSDTLTSTALYFSLSVAHGSAATTDVYIFGDVLQ